MFHKLHQGKQSRRTIWPYSLQHYVSQSRRNTKKCGRIRT